MSMKPFLLLLSFAVVFASGLPAQEKTRREPAKKFQAAYASQDIKHIRVHVSNTGTGTILLFDAGTKHFAWRFSDDGGAEVSAIFTLADRLASASKIDVQRWLPREGDRDRDAFSVGETVYYFLTDLTIFNK
jgi:hypothetical protein